MKNKTREQKLQYIHDYMQGRAIAPIMGIVYIHEGRVFGYQTAESRERFSPEEEVTLEEFRKQSRPVSHEVRFQNFSGGNSNSL